MSRYYFTEWEVAKLLRPQYSSNLQCLLALPQMPRLQEYFTCVNLLSCSPRKLSCPYERYEQMELIDSLLPEILLKCHIWYECGLSCAL